ncbi:DiNV CH01M ORF107-like protein [Mauternbach virus]|uniref:DiNV CH01M ORF107-like protein n=1 Tax=Mauternbach virus TaxID=2486603 RepID=A0A3G3E658_9VIRU|nr:DiNV CH01M ORF107-like protein [Mauternbach virus]AYP97956.1 DiNV CH01M ORF107-like protein [Mauternbach virus]
MATNNSLSNGRDIQSFPSYNVRYDTQSKNNMRNDQHDGGIIAVDDDGGYACQLLSKIALAVIIIIFIILIIMAIASKSLPTIYVVTPPPSSAKNRNIIDTDTNDSVDCGPQDKNDGDSDDYYDGDDDANGGENKHSDSSSNKKSNETLTIDGGDGNGSDGGYNNDIVAADTDNTNVQYKRKRRQTKKTPVDNFSIDGDAIDRTRDDATGSNKNNGSIYNNNADDFQLLIKNAPSTK